VPDGRAANQPPQANDNIATWKDGNRYRIFVNPQVRVVSTKLYRAVGLG
jgi:hypothetical protein